jgi:hypothetical protein
MAKVYFDEFTCSCSVGNKTVDLNDLNYQLLKKLYEYKNKVVTEAQLIEAVSPDHLIGPEHVKQRIKQLQLAMKTAGIWQFSISRVSAGKYGLRIKTNPAFVLAIAALGLILFGLAFRYVIVPLADSVTIVNNRVVVWETSEIVRPFENYALLTETWREQLAESDILLYVNNDRDMSFQLVEQARYVRAGLIILWHGSDQPGQAYIDVQIIEPKTTNVLHEQRISAYDYNRAVLTMKQLRDRIEQFIVSPLLPLGPEVLEDNNHPTWQRLREILDE